MSKSVSQCSNPSIWGANGSSSSRAVWRDYVQTASTRGTSSQNLLEAALPGCGFGTTLSPLELTALHEAGHAVSWHLGGGTIGEVTLKRRLGGWEGFCRYELKAPYTRHERHLLARSGLAATLLCDVAGFPDLSEAWTYDYTAAIKALQPLYRSERGLAQAAARCWCDAVEIVSCPVGFRSAVALAWRLARERTLVEFPDTCHIRDLAPVPGLDAVADRLRNDFERAQQQDVAWSIAWAAGRNAP